MHILSAEQFNREWLESLFDLTNTMKQELATNRQELAKKRLGKQVSLVFYEPSTRTRLSFAHGAQHLGISVSSTENAREFSSAAKGETIEDTVRVLEEYKPDAIVMRHHETGSVAQAAAVSKVPIINAGDGAGEHPTQALLDAYTILDECGRLDNLKIVLGGDLLHGRTARSLAKLLTLFKGNQLTFASIPDLQMANDIKEYLDKAGLKWRETNDLKDAAKDADVLYWTRLQDERFNPKAEDEPDVKKVKQELSEKLHEGFQTLSVTAETLKLLPKKAVVMHPLPRRGEIKVEVDSDPRAAYFRQAGNGMYVRMALLDQILTSA